MDTLLHAQGPGDGQAADCAAVGDSLGHLPPGEAEARGFTTSADTPRCLSGCQPRCLTRCLVGCLRGCLWLHGRKPSAGISTCLYTSSPKPKRRPRLSACIPANSSGRSSDNGSRRSGLIPHEVPSPATVPAVNVDICQRSAAPWPSSYPWGSPLRWPWPHVRRAWFTRERGSPHDDHVGLGHPRSSSAKMT